MAIFNKYKALFHDKKGVKIGTQSFKQTDANFRFQKGKHHGAYIVNLKCPTFDETTEWLGLKKTTLFYYNIENPEPLILGQAVVPMIDPRMLRIQLDTHLAEQLNDLPNESWWKNVPLGWLIAGGVGIFLIIYIATGHKLF